MKALILIGGEGTRLRPLTIDTLKCMAPIANRPFIEYQINLLKKYGIKDIILSVCHMPHKVKELLGSGKKYGVRLEYADEKSPLGTGGAIKNCEEFLDDTTVVMNGDILTDIKIDSLIKTHVASKAIATIALRKVSDPSAYGLVETNSTGRVLKFIEKPKNYKLKSGWINAGMYIFDKKVMNYIPDNIKVSIERETFPGIIKSGYVLGSYKADYYWLDIGRIDKYMQANFDVLEGKITVDKKSSRGKNCKFGKSIIDKRSVLGSFVTVGNGVIIENSVILDKTKIKDGSVISNSLICGGCVINENCSVVNAALGSDTNLAKFTKLGA